LDFLINKLIRFNKFKLIAKNWVKFRTNTVDIIINVMAINKFVSILVVVRDRMRNLERHKSVARLIILIIFRDAAPQQYAL